MAQETVGKKIVINFNESTKEKLESALVKIRSYEHSKNVKLKEIVTFLIDNIDDRDIKKISESYMTVEDKVKIQLREHNKKNNSSLTYDEYLTLKLKL